MKSDSKILCILTLFIVMAIAVSSVIALDLEKSDFYNGNFTINVPSGCDFDDEAVTNVNADDVIINLAVFQNHGNASGDVGTIIYLKDSSSDRNVISGFLKDLKNDGEVVEKTDNFTLLKIHDSKAFNLSEIDLENDLNGILSIADGLLSSHGNINMSSEGNSISLSDRGLEVSGADGENISISGDGIKVSGSEEGEASAGADITVDSSMLDDMGGAEYAACVESPDAGQVILIAGNNLEVIRAMADTASFK